MDRSKLGAMIGTLALLGALGGAVYVLMPWKTKAELAAGDPLYGQLMAALNAAEIQYALPTDLLARLAYEESGFSPAVISGSQPSSAGALGLMQFMPATAASLGIDPTNPAQAIPAAASYLSGFYDQFGSWGLALAAYNAGAANVTKYGGIPPFPETQSYVSDILGDVNAELGTAYA